MFNFLFYFILFNDHSSIETIFIDAYKKKTFPFAVQKKFTSSSHNMSFSLLSVSEMKNF